MKKIPVVENKLQLLQSEELKLFHSYNRHAEAPVKLNILSQLISIINKIEVLKQL